MTIPQSIIDLYQKHLSIMNNGRDLVKLRQSFRNIRDEVLGITDYELKRKVGTEIMRNVIQDIDLAIITHDKVLLSQKATGVGKTRPAVLAMNEFGTNHLILHKQIPHIGTWKDEIAKWGHNINPQYSTYNSMHKKIGKKWDVLILDESHAITEAKLPYLKELEAERIIYLSATMPSEKKSLIRRKGAYKNFEVTLKDAIDWGILPVPEVYVMYHNLKVSGETETFYVHKGKTFPTVDVSYRERWKYVGKGKKFNVNIACSEKQYYDLLMENYEYWRKRYFQKQERWAKDKWLQWGSKRKNWLAEKKTYMVKRILEIYPKQRMLVFANGIKQCNELAGKNYRPVHSKNDSKLWTNDRIIREFHKYKSDRLFAVGVLNESMNFKDLFGSIITSTAGKNLSNEQRFGRSTRSEVPKIFLPVVKDTKDEENLISFLQGLSDDYITYLN